jgi:hypothetical protein
MVTPYRTRGGTLRLSRVRRLDIHRAFPEAVVGRGRVQTDGARRHAPSSSRRFRKEARQGGYCSGRSDRQRILSRRGDRAARQASRDRGPQAGAYPTQALRRQVTRRNQIIRQTVREKFSCRDCEAISQPPAPYHVVPRRAGPSETRLEATGAGGPYKSALYPTLLRIDAHLVRWVQRMFKRFRQQPRGARAWLAGVVRTSPDLFAHWPLVHANVRTLGAV